MSKSFRALGLAVGALALTHLPAAARVLDGSAEAIPLSMPFDPDGPAANSDSLTSPLPHPTSPPIRAS